MQRYEREMGLPVRRPAARPHGIVMATRAELDAWVSASPIRHEFQISKLTIASEQRTSTTGIHVGLAQMRELRTQLKDLRSEVGACVQSLERGLQTLQDQLNADRSRGIGNLYSLGQDLAHKDLVNLVNFPSPSRKVS